MAFILSKYENSGVQIIDTSEYLSESSTSEDFLYTYTESYTVNVLYKVDINKKLSLVDYAIEEHRFNPGGIPMNNKSIIEFKEDGLHQVTQLILPNKEWMLNNSQRSDFENIYYCDGTDIYDVNDNKIAVTDLNLEESNVLSKSKYTFTFDKLLKWFTEESIKVLNDGEKDLVRNILWIGIDVIKYCLQQGWYFEAERRLQQIKSCLALSTSNNTQKSLGNCGCLKTLWMNFSNRNK